MQVPALSARGILIDSKTCGVVFVVLHSEIVDRIWIVVSEKKTCGIMTCRMNNLEID